MEQKFKDFLSKYNNQFVEKVDATNKYQCFDLAIAWCEFLGLPLSIFSGLMYAYQIYTKPTDITTQNFTLIANTPDGVPQAGDIVVWDRLYNGVAGHVGIATGKADTNTFECFEQNDPTGSNSHVRTYNYNHVAGWLQYKLPVVTQPMARTPEDAKYIAQLEKAVNDKDAKIKALEDENLQLSEKIETERSNHIAELAQKDTECQTKINEIKAIPPKVEEKIVTMPYEWQHWVLRAIIPVLQDWDMSHKKLPVSGDVRK